MRLMAFLFFLCLTGDLISVHHYGLATVEGGISLYFLLRVIQENEGV